MKTPQRILLVLATSLALAVPLLPASGSVLESADKDAATDGPRSVVAKATHPCEVGDPCDVSTNYTILDKMSSAPLSRCIGFQLEGKLSYRRTDYYADPLNPGTLSDRNYSRIKITAPSLRVHTYDTCSNLDARNVTKVTVRQDFHHQVCSLNADISFSAPWGIEVDPGYGCNGKKQAARTTTYNETTNSFWQANSAQVLGWSGIDSRNMRPPNPDPKQCVVVRYSAVVYRGATSDSVNGSSKICPLN